FHLVHAVSSHGDRLVRQHERSVRVLLTRLRIGRERPSEGRGLADVKVDTIDDTSEPVGDLEADIAAPPRSAVRLDFARASLGHRAGLIWVDGPVGHAFGSLVTLGGAPALG